MAVDILDWNSIIDWLYDPFRQLEDTIHIGGGETGDPDAEERTIPNTFPYQIKLFFAPKYEIPSNFVINIKNGATLNEVPDVQEPGYNQYRVCYDEKGLGIVEFNSLQKNQIVEISYKATASTIQKALFDSFQKKVLGDIDDKFQDTFLPFTDGINWVTKNLNTMGFDGSVNHIAYDEELHKFIAAGKLTTYLKIWTSEDLTTWTEILSVNKGAMTHGFKKIVYSTENNIWVAIGDYIYYSYNLVDWTESTMPAGLDYANDCIYIEEYELFFAAGMKVLPAGNCFIQSADGITWTASTIVNHNPYYVWNVTRLQFDNNLLFSSITTYDSGNYRLSFAWYDDGNDRFDFIEYVKSTGDYYAYDVNYVDSLGLYILCGSGGNIYTASGLSIPSLPGNWTSRASGVVTDLKKIAKTESRVIIAGDDKTILVSSNGTSYTDYSLSGTDEWDVSDIIFENDILLIITTDNRIIYSDDITTFTELPLTPITIGLLGIVFINNIFLLYGDSGFISMNGLFFWGLSDSRFAVTETEYNNINTRLTTIETYPKSKEILGLTDSILKITNSSGDYDHDISIASGISCWDSSLSVFMGTGSAMIKKIDAAWAAGTNQGGIFTGAVAANTTYHLFMIKKDSDGTIDFGFDTSLTAANKPAGYTYYRRIWSVITDSSSNIIRFHQYQKYCAWTTRILNYNTYPVNTNRNSISMISPLDIITKIKLLATLYIELSSGNFGVAFTALNETDYTPDVQSADLTAAGSNDTSDALIGASIIKDVFSNSSSQIGWRSSSTSPEIYIYTLGYDDIEL